MVWRGIATLALGFVVGFFLVLWWLRNPKEPKLPLRPAPEFSFLRGAELLTKLDGASADEYRYSINRDMNAIRSEIAATAKSLGWTHAEDFSGRQYDKWYSSNIQVEIHRGYFEGRRGVKYLLPGDKGQRTAIEIQVGNPTP